MKIKQPLKKRLLALLLCLCVTLGLLPLSGTVLAANTVPDVCDGSVATGFDGGDGSEEDPYIIATSAQLAYLQRQVYAYGYVDIYEGEHFVLTRNLDLNNVPWTPIGQQKSSFKGSIDGQGHTISNLTVSDASVNPEGDQLALGLFGDYEGE